MHSPSQMNNTQPSNQSRRVSARNRGNNQAPTTNNRYTTRSAAAMAKPQLRRNPRRTIQKLYGLKQ